MATTSIVTAKVTDFNTIKKVECAYTDRYLGTEEDLIAAGVIRADQVPGAPGKPRSTIRFWDGVPVVGKKRVPWNDPRFMCVAKNGRKLLVIVGIPQDLVDAREAARLRAFERGQVDERARLLAFERGRTDERKRQEAERLAAQLRDLPKDEQECRRKLARKFREWLRAMVTEPKYAYGHTIDEESIEAILISGDAVVEALMDAEIKFDIAGDRRCRAALASSDLQFQGQLERLTRAQPELLPEGEQS